MNVKMTFKEFKQLQAFVKNSKNVDIINHFNKVFDLNSDSIVKGAHNALYNDFEFNIPEKEMCEILAVFAQHSSNLGTMLKFDLNMRSVPKWLSVLSDIIAQIKKSLRY